jgi:tetrapyrrole methylase family protein/MazG family protein
MIKPTRGNSAASEGESPSALLQTYELTKKASRLGFDWPDVAGVVAKMDEEVKELKEALDLQDRKKIQDELGDLLFVLVNVARFLRINPEKALTKTIAKFNRRFSYIEKALRKMGKSFEQSDLTEMDRLWEEAKRKKRIRHRTCTEGTKKK